MVTKKNKLFFGKNANLKDAIILNKNMILGI